MNARGDVSLICPGLVGPPDLEFGSGPPTPALDRLLSRADCRETPPRDPLETLAAAFDLTPVTACQSPPAVEPRHSDRLPNSGARDGPRHAGPGPQDEAPPATGPDRDLPTAAICLSTEAPDLARDGCWFHADPVHLRADRDRLVLFAGPSITDSALRLTSFAMAPVGVSYP